LSIAEGLHVPEIPFCEIAGSTGTVVPLQIVIDVPKLNVVVTIGFTKTSKLVDVAH